MARGCHPRSARVPRDPSPPSGPFERDVMTCASPTVEHYRRAGTRVMATTVTLGLPNNFFWKDSSVPVISTVVVVETPPYDTSFFFSMSSHWVLHSCLSLLLFFFPSLLFSDYLFCYLRTSRLYIFVCMSVITVCVRMLTI